MGGKGRYEVVKYLVADDFIATGIGPQMNGDDSVSGSAFGPRSVFYHQHTLLGLLSKQKVARNGLLFGVGEVNRVVGFENDEFEVNFLPHAEARSPVRFKALYGLKRRIGLFDA